ncbi:hypothetical protein TeGR_g11386 [Tetraparma gracilis]|uniref:Transmembrane protein n=1 Tax=Tetraparma gracilis TaxID=2962635 RepID=A0ABQ6MIE2_9STRA|nr:hypothetical protein TeGR_g11386 [Tetraparma gracilis]
MGLSVPFFLGGVLGYRRALSDDAHEDRPAKSSGKRASNPLLDAGPARAAAPAGKRAFNPALHAARAFGVGSMLAVGSFGLVLGALGYANGVEDVGGGVELLRGWGGRLREGVLVKVMGERATRTREETEREVEEVRGMSYEEEMAYVERRWFGGGGNPESVQFERGNPESVQFGSDRT